MSFTGGNTLPNIGKRNWQIVILAGGLALALSVGALTGAFEREGSPATTAVSQPAAEQLPAGPATAPVSRAGDAPSEMVYFVVGSQAEARILDSVINTEAASIEGIGGNQDTILEVVVLENREQEAQFNDLLAMSTAELMSIDVGLRVVDLRETAAPALGLSTSDAEGGEAAANIVYIVSSEAEKLNLEQQFHEATVTAVDHTNRSVIVVGPGQEGLYNTIVGDQMTYGTFDIVDLR